ncbi:GxxExxY protein [Candidatus Sumerlaeota bacterium]|nr:GxxExxY protein [Candidatus Sumerlaeota bacterium]MBI3735273.1 GxxExxY protein [Candidatus Sumerlaeota bacterium]
MEECGHEETQKAQKGTFAHSAPFRGDIFALCDVIRETAFAIHKFLRHGHLEKVYENTLVHRLRKQGIRVEQQVPIKVRDEDGTIVGEFVADMIVEANLIVEVKACKALADEHIAQALGYLRATEIEHALLINFGAPKLQVKKLILSREHPHEA